VLKRFVESNAAWKTEDEKGIAYKWAPLPEWYNRLVKAGGRFTYSNLTPSQRREARAFGIEDESKE